MLDEEFKLAVLEELSAIRALVTKPDKQPKDPKPIETPEQWLARLRVEFKDQPDLDACIEACKTHYRVKRQRCGRGTIESWLLRQRRWRLENGVPEETAGKKHGGLVL
jgi:hypothetical protein